MTNYDAMMANKSIADLTALKTATDARLAEFVEDGNLEQTVTYRCVQAAIERALATQQEHEARTQLAAMRKVVASVPSYCERDLSADIPSSPWDDADLELMLESEFGPRTHTPECAAQMADNQAVRDAWLARYGGSHCQHCAMSGIEASIHFDEPPVCCPHCTGRGKCAQCGAAFDIDNEERCSSCGWHEGVEIPTGGWCVCQPVALDLSEPPF